MRRRARRCGARPRSMPNDATFISGAPRVFKDKVAIGFGDSGTTPGRVSAFDVASGKPVVELVDAGRRRRGLERHHLRPGQQSRVCGHRQCARCRCREECVCLQRGGAQRRYRRDGVALRLGARRSPAVRRLHRHHAGHGHHRRASRATSSSTRRKTGLSTCSIAPAARRSPSKKLGVGAHNHFAQSFSPKTGLAYVPTTELPASNVDGDAPADAGKSALVAWDPVKQQPLWAVPTPGAFSGGVLSTAGELVFQGQADGYSRPIPRPKAVACGRSIPRRRRSARRSVSRSASASTSRYSTDRRRARPEASVRCPRDSVGIHARIRGACSRSCSMARAHCRPRRGPTFATPVDGGDLVVDEALAKAGAQLFTKCQWCHGAGAIAGGGAPGSARFAVAAGGGCRLRRVVRGGIEVSWNAEVRRTQRSGARRVAALHSRAGTTRHATRRRGAAGA